jgi:hypothetical protein
MNHHRTRFPMLVLVILSAALSGCGVLRGWIAPAGLDYLDSVQTIKIADTWVGLTPASPLFSYYDLTTDDDGAWVGTGVIEAGRPKISREEAITVPAEAVERFVEIMNTAVLLKGTYHIDTEDQNPDDYPVITLNFKTDRGYVTVYTYSSAENHVPWGVIIDGIEYVIDGDVPARAMDEIMPYLRYDIRDAMIEELMAEAESD